MRCSLLALGLLVSFLSLLNAEPVSLLDQGRSAEAAENYQSAMDLYQRAAEADPNNPEPLQSLAELYSAKGLHELAVPVWKEVISRSPADPLPRIALAQAYSYLDDNRQSVLTLEAALKLFPKNPDVVQALAWMLFKTEDFLKGISLVEDYLKGEVPDRSLEMTLGTLYSSVSNYDLSRIHYLKSIDLAPGDGSHEKNFRAIAWYNLSLLEKGFYQFELAEQAIRRSLEEEDRPAGQLALGEIFQGRGEYTEARRLYEKAVAVDETPLGRFDLARLLQKTGALDEAEAQLGMVEKHKDDTWIYNYGVTKDKVKRDLHEVRADLHRSRFLSLDFAPRQSFLDWVTWSWSKLREGLLWWYYDQTWKSLLTKLSQASQEAGNSPEAWTSLALAYRDRPSLAIKYLDLVRGHELPKNPRAKAAFWAEEGILSHRVELLSRALADLQTPWENEDRERVLASAAQVAREQGRAGEFSRLLGQLYTANPGGLPLLGWGLPVRWAVYGEPSAVNRWNQQLADFAGYSGWNAASSDRPGVEWTLELRVGTNEAAWTLRNPDGEALRSGAVTSAAEVFRAIHSPGR